MKILRNIKPGYYELHYRIVSEYFKFKNEPIYAYARILYIPINDKHQFQRFDLNCGYFPFNLDKNQIRYTKKDLGEETSFSLINEQSFDVLKIPRNDKQLIKAVELFNLTMLETDNCMLEIVEIPDGVDWEIKEISANPHYFGSPNNIEKIVEKHREW